MPYSFTQIERDKSKVILWVFVFVIFIYFASFWLVSTVIFNYIHYHDLRYPDSPPFQFSWLGAKETLNTFFAAVMVGFFHWLYTISNLIPKILKVLEVQPLDKTDTFHQRLQNVVDEVSVATGGKKIEAVVIPSTAMNAFALADFSGRSVIGITEGLLARLSREQLEAVVGHEAAHIVAGDCLATTVTSSLFELYNGCLKAIELVMRSERSSSYSQSRRRGGTAGFNALIFVIYLILMVMRFFSYLVRMFISREREFRADAVAVRLTRNPLALAEALYGISFHWRGESLAAEELSSIFIVNPKFSMLDEREGFFADLFATHPPVNKRLSVLLNMAHAKRDFVESAVAAQDQQPREVIPENPRAAPQWMVFSEGQWQGPFELEKIAQLKGVKSDTWVQRLGDQVKMAYEDKDVAGLFNKKPVSKDVLNCPRCRISVFELDYEGTTIHRCPMCQGTLSERRDVEKIIVRQIAGFPERITRLAEGIKEEQLIGNKKHMIYDPNGLFNCPRCPGKNMKMNRTFYTEVYPVEVDRCYLCGLHFFDKDELETLQCLIEKNTTPQK